MNYATVQTARLSPWGPMLLGYHMRPDGAMGSWLSDAVDSVEKTYKKTSAKVARYLAKNPQVGQIVSIGAAAIPGVGLVAGPAVAAATTYASFEGAKRLQKEAERDYLASIAAPSSAGPVLSRIPIAPGPAQLPPRVLVAPSRPTPSAYSNLESTAATAAIAVVLVAILAARRA